MELRSRIVALYGRFSSGVRTHLAEEIVARSGRATRDLARQTDILVVGARADTLIDNGALSLRLADARRRGKPVLSEAGFRRAIAGQAADEPTLPADLALAQSGMSLEDAALLAAFDLIDLKRGFCRFRDVALLKAAAQLKQRGCSAAQIIRILDEARRISPPGRRTVGVSPAGEPVLQWEDGTTTLSGQRLLPLDETGPDLDDLFEAAAIAEMDGDLETSARLFDMCARADRSDALSLHNLGNIRLREQNWAAALLAYQRALARDPDLIEARYNLAQALEALGRDDNAIDELREILVRDKRYSDALFNLGGLLMKGSVFEEARQAFEHYLRTDPSTDWAAKARKAIAYCSHRLLAS